MRPIQFAESIKMKRLRATIQLTTMELVIGKLKGRAISTALADRPCSFGSKLDVADPCSAVEICGMTDKAEFTAQPQFTLTVINTEARSNSVNLAFGWTSSLMLTAFAGVPLGCGLRPWRPSDSPTM